MTLYLLISYMYNRMMYHEESLCLEKHEKFLFYFIELRIPLAEWITSFESDTRAQGRDTRAQGRDTRAQGRDTRAQGRDTRAQGRDTRAQETAIVAVERQPFWLQDFIVSSPNYSVAGLRLTMQLFISGM